LAEASDFRRFLVFFLPSGLCGCGGVARKWRTTFWNSGSFVGSDLFTMADLFHSPMLTLDRAHHHVRDFNEVVNRFIAEKPWTRLIDKDSNPGCDLHKIKFTQRIPESLVCILFDAANNLRAVLDQVGYASALAADSASLSHIKFPISSCEKEFRNACKGCCKDVPAEVRAIFERSNAYIGGKGESLWAINTIANAHKHFALKPLNISAHSIFFTARVETAEWISETVSPGGAGIGWDPVKYEVTLVSVPSGAKADINSNVAFTVAVEGIQAFSSKSIAGVLADAQSIATEVVREAEMECRRLFPSKFF
jgi:hypothetical protein